MLIIVVNVMRKSIWIVLLFLLMVASCTPAAVPATPPASAQTVSQASSTVTPRPVLTATATTQPTATASATEIPLAIGGQDAISFELIGQANFYQPFRITWLPDGISLGIMGRQDLYIVDSQTMIVTVSLEIQQPDFLLDFSPDGSKAVATSDRVSLQLLSVADGSLMQTIQPENPFQDAHYTPDGRYLAVDSIYDIAVTLYDTSDGSIQRELKGFTTAAPVYHFQFSSDGRYLIWYARAAVQPMDLQTGELGPRFEHEDFINSLALQPDGNILAVSTDEYVGADISPLVKLWDINSGQALGLLLTDPPVPTGIDFSPDGRWIAAGTGPSVSIWEVSSQQMAAQLPVPDAEVVALAFSPDGSQIAVIDRQGNLLLWSLLLP
jgi:WD40 repeat protein